MRTAGYWPLAAWGPALKGGGKVILMRYMVGSASTEAREKGFTETLAKEFPEVSMLSDTEYAGATVGQSCNRRLRAW